MYVFGPAALETPFETLFPVPASSRTAYAIVSQCFNAGTLPETRNRADGGSGKREGRTRGLESHRQSFFFKRSGGAPRPRRAHEPTTLHPSAARAIPHRPTLVVPNPVTPMASATGAVRFTRANVRPPALAHRVSLVSGASYLRIFHGRRLVVAMAAARASESSPKSKWQMWSPSVASIDVELELYVVLGATPRTPGSAIESLARQRLTPPPGTEGFSDDCLAAREDVLTATVEQLSFPAARAEYDTALAAGQTTVAVPLDKLSGALALLQVRCDVSALWLKHLV